MTREDMIIEEAARAFNAITDYPPEFYKTWIPTIRKIIEDVILARKEDEQDPLE